VVTCTANRIRSDGHRREDGLDDENIDRRGCAGALHVVPPFAAALGDRAVQNDQNEITAALALPKSLPPDGAVTSRAATRRPEPHAPRT